MKRRQPSGKRSRLITEKLGRVISGASVAEYSLLAGLVAIVAIVSVGHVGVRTADTLDAATQELAKNGVGDTLPDAFGFFDVEGAEPTTFISSNIVTLGGLSAEVTASISGAGAPMLQVNDGEWVASARVGNEDRIRIGLESSSEWQSPAAAELEVGAESANFTVTTRAPDTDADPMFFPPVEGVDPEALVQSQKVAVGGIEVPLTARVAGLGDPMIGVNQQAPAPEVQVADGDEIFIMMTASPGWETARDVTLSIGDLDTSFVATTRAADVSPDTVSFQRATGQEPASQYTWPSIVVGGIEAPVAISASGDGTPQFRINGGGWAESDYVETGDVVDVRMMSAAGWEEVAAGQLLVGDQTSGLEIETRAAVITPQAFAFADVSGAEPGEVYASESVGIYGIEIATEVTVSGEGAPEVQVNGGVWSSTASVQNGDSIRVRLTSGKWEDARSATVSVGTHSSEFSVIVRSRDAEPDMFSFDPATGLDPSQTVLSTAVEMSGFDETLLASVAGDGAPRLRVDGGEWVESVQVAAGDLIELRADAPAAWSTSTEARLDVNGVSSGFRLTTRAPDISPDTVAFASIVGSEPSTLRTSGEQIIADIEVPISVLVSGDGSPRLQVNGESWVSSATVEAGDKVRLRLTSSASWEASHEAVLSYGDKSASFAVGTRSRDTAPDSFGFASVSGVEPGSLTTSQEIVLGDFDGSLAATLTDAGAPQMRVNGGSWSSSASVRAGDRIALRLTSGSWSDTRTATLSIGTRSGRFEVSTRAIDATANSFSFPSVLGAELDDLRYSETRTITGFDETLVAGVSGHGAQIQVNGNGWKTSDTIRAGDKLRVRMKSSTSYSNSRTATVSVGSRTTGFKVSTRARDTMPDAVSFSRKEGVERETLYYSNEITVNGVDGSVSASIDYNFGDARFQINGGSWVTSGSVRNGDKVRLRTRSSNLWDDPNGAWLTIGSRQDVEWVVKTRSKDSYPDGFTFPSVWEAEPDDLRYSSTRTISGFDESLTASVSNHGAQIQINGGSWRTSGTIRSGDKLRVRMKSANAWDAARLASVSVGSRSTNFKVTTRDRDVTPDAFAFGRKDGVELETYHYSPSKTLKGFDGTLSASIRGDWGEAVFQINGGSWRTSGSVKVGDVVRIRLQASTLPDTAHGGWLTVGARTEDFKVRTRLPDTTPNGFSNFESVTTSPWQWVESEVQTIEGLETSEPTPVGVSVSGEGSPDYKVYSTGCNCWSGWGDNWSVRNGWKVKMQMKAGSRGSTRTSYMTIGGVKRSFSVKAQ